MANEQDYSVGGYLKGCLNSAAAMMKNPLYLFLPILSTVLVTGIQLALSVMTARGMGGDAVLILSMLTYSNGGMYGGIPGAIGGLLGRCMLIFFFNAVLMGMATGENPFVNLGRGIGRSFSSLAFKRLFDPAAWLFGAAFSLLIATLCNFTQNRMNGMIGAYLMVMCLGSLGRKNGFLYGLFLRMFVGKNINDEASRKSVAAMMAGSAFGYMLAMVLTMIGLKYSLLIGLILLVPALLLFAIAMATGKKGGQG